MNNKTITIYYKTGAEDEPRLVLDVRSYEIELKFIRCKGDEKVYICQNNDPYIKARVEELFTAYKWLHAKLLNVEEFTEQEISHKTITNPTYKAKD